MCKVTDCVTGETYVRGAAGRLAAEVDRLKARIADLEQENDELQRKKPCYGFGSANPPTDPTHPSIVLLQQQQHQAKLREQQISKLQIENTQVQKRAAVLKDKNETLQKRIEEQEALLRLTDVCPRNLSSGHNTILRKHHRTSPFTTPSSITRSKDEQHP